MEQNKFLRIFALVAFIAFAAISCWATAESLQLSSRMPAPVCWVISVGFFVVAAIGTTMIVNSLNQRIEVENRGWKLTGGIILVIVFWLFCSMPTNTHTFFYWNKKENVTEDIGTTIKYLDQLAKAQKVTDSIEGEFKPLKEKLWRLKIDLEEEIKNHGNPGVAIYARGIMNEIARLSGQEIRELSKSERSGWTELAEAYGKKVQEIIDFKEAEKNSTIEEIKKNSLYVKEAKTNLIELQNAELAIKEGDLSLINAEHMKILNKKLINGYGTIGTYSQWVSFSSPEDEALYKAEKPFTKTNRMIDVFAVWKEFLQGKYRGQGLWYWVVISILLDVAAFIFFDIAFAKREDA